MKTYTTLCALFALVIFSCSKSENSSGEKESENTSIDADYVALLTKDGMLMPQLLNANAEVITLNPAASSLSEKIIPDLRIVNGSSLLQYRKDGDCSGEITRHNFKSDVTTAIPVFADLNACNLTATAIASSDDFIFISYVITSSNPDEYLLRIIDVTNSEFSSVDVSLDKKPVDLTIADNRLFILTLDEQITDENSLSVMEISNKELVHEMNLGNDVRRIFTDTQNNVIISYDELHTNLNSSTLAVVYTRYDNNPIPKFAYDTSRNFDAKGRLFYTSEPDEESSSPLVATSYDFESNLVTRYLYERIISEEKLNFEYNIKTTTAVNFDNKNNIVLVGYEKADGNNLGGILRIKLDSSNKIKGIDNIDLDGLPVEIIVN